MIRDGDIAQCYRLCLLSVRPSVQCPTVLKKKKKVNKWMDELMINRVASGMDGTGP